jgi:transposase
MESKSKIVKHMDVEDLIKEIHKIEMDAKMLNKLHLMLQVYRTNDIVKSCEFLGIPVRTGHDWVKKWNDNGIDGLRHKKGAGRPSFLSTKQFEEVDKWIENQEYPVAYNVYLYIKDNFGIDYSRRQINRIINNLGYVRVKPYPIAENQPENAEELLKKSAECIDPDNDIYGFVDEVAVQNTPNVNRILKKGSKPTVKVNPKKFKKTAVGFQAVNGNPHLIVGDNLNSGIFSVFLIETKELNSVNEETKEILKDIRLQENVQDEYIENMISERSKDPFIDNLQKKINNDGLTKDELVEKLQTELNNENSKDKRKISKIKSENIALYLIKKFDINIDKNTVTNYAKLRNFVKNEELMEKKIENYFPDEKRIVMILDNYSVHISYLVRLIAKILNIKLIFLPGYSPNLNPIEQVWRTLKAELYTVFIEDEYFLAKRFTKIFYKIINRPSFTKKWKEKYIAKK